MLEVGAAWGLGWTMVSAHSGDRFRSIIDESEWQKVSGKARRWAVSACHVTLIDTALLRWHRHPSVRVSCFSLRYDLFTGTLDWTIIGVVQAYLVVSVMSCPLKSLAACTGEYQEQEIGHVARGVQHMYQHIFNKALLTELTEWIIIVTERIRDSPH